MRTKAIEALGDGAYLTARIFGKSDPETVRLLRVEHEAEDRGYVESSPRIHFRRFLTGGFIDTWTYPRDILARAEPDAGLLRAFEYIEREVGEKPRQSWHGA